MLKQLLEAANIDTKRWTPKSLSGLIDHWKKPRLDARETAARRGFRQRQGPGPVRRLSGASAVAERLRLRRPSAAQHHHPVAARGPGRGIPSSLPLHPGRRVSGHQCRPVSVAAASDGLDRQCLLRGRRRPVDLWLARGRGGQHPAVRARLPRRQDRQVGAELSLDPPYPRRGVRPDRGQPRPSGQDPVDRGRWRRQGAGARRLGRRGRGPG